MRAGFYAADITPPIGAMRAGSYSPIFIQGIAGPMKVRAAVLESGDRRVAVVGVDCCLLHRHLVETALAHLENNGGPALDDVIISASHTHSGAAVSGFAGTAVYTQMAPEVRDLLKDSAVPDPWYTDWVARQLATAILMAAKRLEPAQINTGVGTESGMVFQRRFICKDGRAYSHPGKMNPDIVAPAGPVDPAVGVIGAWREDGSLIGAIVNFACHGTTYSGSMAHADWYHFVEDTLQKLFGAEAGVVITNGPCGDVTQVNNQSLSRDFGVDVTRRLGLRVGAEAAKVLISAPRQAAPTLASTSCILPIPRRVPTPASLVKAWEVVRAKADNPAHPDAVFARERLFAGEVARIEPEKQVHLTAIQVGDAVLLSTAAEYFTSLGLRIKQSSPFPHTMVVELANDSIGYVPDLAAFDPKTGGGYETVLTAYSCLIPEAGDRIADRRIEMSRTLTPDRVAAPAESKPGSYWDYGRRGPDLE